MKFQHKVTDRKLGGRSSKPFSGRRVHCSNFKVPKTQSKYIGFLEEAHAICCRLTVSYLPLQWSPSLSLLVFLLCVLVEVCLYSWEGGGGRGGDKSHDSIKFSSQAQRTITFHSGGHKEMSSILADQQRPRIFNAGGGGGGGIAGSQRMGTSVYRVPKYKLQP